MRGGFGPMSCMKFSNDSHLPQTETPRPPYSGKSLLLGFWHRCRIPFQMKYVGVFACPCLTAGPLLFRPLTGPISAIKHLHDLTFPPTSSDATAAH